MKLHRAAALFGLITLATFSSVAQPLDPLTVTAPAGWHALAAVSATSGALDAATLQRWRGAWQGAGSHLQAADMPPCSTCH